MSKPARVPPTLQRHLQIAAFVKMRERRARKARNFKPARRVPRTFFNRPRTVAPPTPIEPKRRRFRDLIRRRQGARG